MSPVARAVALQPMIAAAAPKAELEGRLAPPVLEALLDANLFRLLMPRAVGGEEVDPVTFLQVVEAVAQADASPAWCIAQTSVCSMVAAALPPDVGNAIFADRRAVLAWGYGPPGRAVSFAGGWRVSGHWSFASGGRHATWLGGTCALHDPDGAAVTDAAGTAVTRMMLFPQSCAAFTDTWQVIGLRGTSSDSYEVADLFVPEDCCCRLNAPTPPHAALYGLPADSLWAAGFASVALGVAAALLQSLIALAREKTPRGQVRPLAEDAPTQALVGAADAALRAARAFLHEAVDAAWHQPAIDLAHRIAIRQAASHAFRAARQVSEDAYHAAGTSAVFADNPFERRLRDMHMIAQHVHGRQQHFEAVGRYRLGGDPGAMFL